MYMIVCFVYIFFRLFYFIYFIGFLLCYLIFFNVKCINLYKNVKMVKKELWLFKFIDIEIN